jgi:serine/threonine protein kinase
MTLLPGNRFGNYEILSHLGAGGMGEVFKAKDSRLGREVALKVLRPDALGNPDRKRRFLREAQATSALNHPNIVVVYEVGAEDGIDFIAMEYVRGKTLDQLIPRKGLRCADALKYAIAVADALAKAHGAGVVHRDLKPGNARTRRPRIVTLGDACLRKLVRIQ